MTPTEADVTEVLSELAKGNQDAAEKLVPLVYDDLKRLARGYLRRERVDQTLQTTALVHEAVPKAVKAEIGGVARALAFLWDRRATHEAYSRRSRQRTPT